MKRLGRNLGLPDSEFRKKLYYTEQERDRYFPENFDLENLISLICQEYGISPDEYHSDFRYGNLPRSRRMVCFILSILGAKNFQIASMTGFKPPRISNAIHDVESNYDDLLHSEKILQEYE